MSEEQTGPVTPDLPAPPDVPDLDIPTPDLAGEESPARQDPDQDVNQDAAKPEPPD